MNKHVRKLTVTGSGSTYYVTLPLELVKELGWRKGEKKTIVKKGSTLVIEDWKKS